MVNYVAPEYEPSGVIEFFDNLPRYGHTENVYEVIDGDRSDYIRGLLLIPGLVVSITIVCFIILVVSMCICRKSFLSGRGYPEGQGAITRAIFLLSTCAVLIPSILFSAKGVSFFLEATDDISEPVEDLFQTVNAGSDVLNQIIFSVRNLTGSNQILQENIDEGVCELLPQEVQDLLGNISIIIGTSDYTDELDGLEDFQNSLESFFSSDTNSDIDNIIEQFRTIIYALRYVTIPHIVSAFLLGCGAVFSWFGYKSKVYTSFLSCFIMPLFTLLVFILSLITSLVGTVLLITSDLCTGCADQSPEGSIRKVLNSVQLNGNARLLFDHYILDGCRTTIPFPGIEEIESAIEVISNQVDKALDSIRGFFEVCGNDVTELDVLLTESNGHLNDLFATFPKAVRLTGCENINSIYIAGIHEGACTSTPRALHWLFACGLTAWIGGLVMLITRAAYHPNHVDKNSKYDSDADKVERW